MINVRKGKKGFIGRPLADRFLEKVDKRSPAECWPWTGSLCGGGYGRIFVNGRPRPAHQVSWELACGEPFPTEKVACHTCDNPPCVNPAHIWPGTMSQNMTDSVNKGRAFRGGRSMWTHCKSGHPLTGANVLSRNGTWRVCKICRDRRNGERKKIFIVLSESTQCELVEDAK